MHQPISFSPGGYRYVLHQIRDRGYTFAKMADSQVQAGGPVAILRHDIDFSVEYALQMARLESEEGACATYFFMTTCAYYNLFTDRSREVLAEIVALGHEVGLHWDSRFLPTRPEDCADFFKAQLLLLSSVTGEKVRSCSQHIPTDTPAFDISPFIEFNAYSSRINQRYQYVSDSSMAWRKTTPLDLIAQGVDMQFLSHPIWWMAEGENQADKIRNMTAQAEQALRDNSEEYLVYMQKVLDDRERFDQYFRETQKTFK